MLRSPLNVGPLAGDVGDVEDLGISAPWEAGPYDLAHLRSRAVAPGDEFGRRRALGAVRPAQPRGDAAALFDIAEQFRRTFDLDAEFAQPVDQQPLVLVLREDVQEAVGVRSEATCSNGTRAASRPCSHSCTPGTV